MSYLLSGGGTIRVPSPPAEQSVYLDVAATIDGTSWDPGIPAPTAPTEWKVYVNGVRQNHGGDWVLNGSVIEFTYLLHNDLVVLSYPSFV